MTASEKLIKKFESGLHICVGLDTDIDKIPKHLLDKSNPILEFNKIIIESTYKHAAAYKINFAFYEKYGSKGFDNIELTLGLIPKDILTIADAKRGDIGNTSQMYAKAIFDELTFDAVTLHPYMGFDSLQPFLDYKEKINFILALTSNKGAEDFEKQRLSDNRFVYQHVIDKVKTWNRVNNCGIVFGATKVDELKNNISNFDNLFILLPGVGTQGGSLEEVVATFKHAGNINYLINVSRALLYSDGSPSFSDAVETIIKGYNKSVLALQK
jgi:orotidine-5'-phosphate decarboxylase